MLPHLYDLYEYSITQDVRDHFRQLNADGYSVDETTNILCAQFADALDDADECVLFWCALADSQADLGVLEPKVLATTMGYINQQQKEGTDNVGIYQALKDKLSKSVTHHKKVKSPTGYHCEWNIGDIFIMPLGQIEAQHLEGRYLLVIVADYYEMDQEHIVPIVRLKITDESTIPGSEEEINNAKYIQVAATRYNDRHLPFDALAPTTYDNGVETVEPDMYGLLHEYQLIMITPSKRVIPRSLKWIGNYSGILPPRDEFIPNEKIMISSCMWRFLEKTAIDRYCGHNLKQYTIYQ